MSPAWVISTPRRRRERHHTDVRCRRPSTRLGRACVGYASAMRICTIGGTRFSGRAFSGLALDEGHEVTIFHRGDGEEVWPGEEKFHADRHRQPEGVGGGGGGG